jgi:DNA-binding MarR family transcriptional regulator
VTPNHRASLLGSPTIDPSERSALIDHLVAGYEAVMLRLADVHAPEIVEIDLTMPRLKVLYLLGVHGELHMSELSARLGVSLPTVSGLVDRLVDGGFARRRDDPADRRQVIVAIAPAGLTMLDRFRDLNARQMRRLLEVLDDPDLEQVQSFLHVLERGVGRLATDSAPTPEEAHS